MTSDSLLKNIYDKFCIPIGAAVSAKFRGAFCEAIVNGVEKDIVCRIQLDNKKTIKSSVEDIIGDIVINNKVKVKLQNGTQDGIILRIIDHSLYYVVFNDDDTGKLRRNQLVLKGDRHYKESESLDKHPLTNPEQFIKAVVCEKPIKERSDADDDDFDLDDQKSCSQESQTTVSSNKTRSRQPTLVSSPSVGTVCSTTKASEDLNKTPVNKPRRNSNTKYSIGSLVITNRVVQRFSSIICSEKNNKIKPFIGLVVSPSFATGGSDGSLQLKVTQCIVKSFRDNHWFLVYKKDIELVVKRDSLIKFINQDPSGNSYAEKSLLYFDAKILPVEWDSTQLFSITDETYPSYSDVASSVDRESTPIKPVFGKFKSYQQHASNSLSSLDSSSSDSDNDKDKDDESQSENDEDQNAKDEWVARFYGFWEDKGNPINNELEIEGKEIDIYRLYELVRDFGGFQKVIANIRWPYIYHLLELPNPSSGNYQLLQVLYKKCINPYVEMKKKLGTFDQGRHRKGYERQTQKGRPLFSARERREYFSRQSTKKTENNSISSQSAGGERIPDRVISGDDGTNSIIEDTSQLSQCSSSPKLTCNRSIEQDQDGKFNFTKLQPGTLVSVSYGDKEKFYKAKIIQQHSPDKKSDGKGSNKPQQQQYKQSIDSVSTVDSVISEFDSSTFYKVHYIGWNSRHDEIISHDRIVEVLSDAGMDNQSSCSSSYQKSNIKSTVSDNEQFPELSSSINMKTDLSIDRFDIDLESSPQTVELEKFPVENILEKDNNSVHQVDDFETAIKDIKDDDNHNSNMENKLVSSEPFRKVNLKRRRSRSACASEPPHIAIKRLPLVPESRIISSLNLYRLGDKMPQPPSITKEIKKESVSKCDYVELPNNDIDNVIISGESSPNDNNKNCITQITGQSLKRPMKDEYDVLSCKVSKIMHNSDALVSMIKPEEMDNNDSQIENRVRSPSFSNESSSDASTLSFRNEEDQWQFYFSIDEDLDEQNRGTKYHSPYLRTKIKTPAQKFPVGLNMTNICSMNNNDNRRRRREQQRADLEIESTSSQHSGSMHGRRVTRSLKTMSDQNLVDDNSVALEDDSQTSQDDSTFQLPTGLPSDNRSQNLTPLASGTPNQKVRRQKYRRKTRNSLSNSSADGCGTCQDANGDVNSIGSVGLCDRNNHPDMSVNNSRPIGREFQRIHPSLVPKDLQSLPPEERVKLLESLIRQTHMNFIDTKEKIKYVEKRLLEIRSCRANGHCVESDEEKFR